MNWLDNVSLNLLSKNLDGLWERQRAISDNLANYETPGYKGKTVSFEDQLQLQMEGANKTSRELVEGIKEVTPLSQVQDDKTFRLDGNGVDLEKENVEFARTQLNYYYSLRATGDELSRLRTAIKGSI